MLWVVILTKLRSKILSFYLDLLYYYILFTRILPNLTLIECFIVCRNSYFRVRVWQKIERIWCTFTIFRAMCSDFSVAARTLSKPRYLDDGLILRMYSLPSIRMNL